MWYAALHHEQLNATISLELNDNFDWNDWNKQKYKILEHIKLQIMST